MVRVASVLSHPICPQGTEKTVDYLGFDKEKFFSWDNIFEDNYFFMEDKENHKITELKEREDFM